MKTNKKPAFISIVVPCMNEQITIGEFVDWCKEGLKKAGAAGEILMIDSSTDKTPQIAKEHGATVISVPKRGLGQAYIDALPYIKGDYVIMGDADLTYDFRELAPFIEKLDEGYEFVMGTRIKGHIEKGAMPALHRYFGNPLTTFLLNLIYGSRYTDIHCGMRGMTKDALIRIQLESPSWEYASEMIIKAVQLGLKTTEIPINFFKDRQGRVSHLRKKWSMPWIAGWINLRALLTYGADFFLYRPGIIMLTAGLALVLASFSNSIKIGSMTFSTYWLLLGSTMTIVGIQSFLMGICAKIIYDPTGEKTKKWLNIFNYTKIAISSSILFIVGMFMAAPLIFDYVRSGFSLVASMKGQLSMTIVGLLLIMCSFVCFTSTLIIHALYKRLKQLRSYAK
jgi:glycosyltransferase involved in cell wall biosynthesis